MESTRNHRRQAVLPKKRWKCCSIADSANSHVAPNLRLEPEELSIDYHEDMHRREWHN
jgi:hypothetical protein